ncbi:MAG: mycothiol system anti-sigma-R factor [Actinobacteria bacterium]|nr:mycothiol system anti-sigma-R factor [Actinomycetota bacterium]
MRVDCPEALERLERYLDGELDDAQIADISMHLARCFPCGDRAEFERQLREVIRTRAAETAPAGLLERVRGRCRETAVLREAAAEA